MLNTCFSSPFAPAGGRGQQRHSFLCETYFGEGAVEWIKLNFGENSPGYRLSAMWCRPRNHPSRLNTYP